MVAVPAATMIAISSKLKILATFTALSFLVASGLPTFVMQAVHVYHVSPSAAGSLESYTTLTQVLASLVMFSVLLRLGYRISVIAGYSLMFCACVCLPFINTIWSIRLYLIATGLSFVAIKIVCYSSVALVVKDEKEHSSFINLMEAFFTAGVIGGMWLYSIFVGYFPAHWIAIFWLFGVICFLMILLWSLSPFDEHELLRQEGKPLANQFREVRHLFTFTILLFAILVFSYESLEQGVGSWLPTFNSNILSLPDALAIQVASLFTVGMVVGRLLGAFVLQRVKWYKLFFVNFTLGIALLLVVVTHIREKCRFAFHLSIQRTCYCLWNPPFRGFHRSSISDACLLHS